MGRIGIGEVIFIALVIVFLFGTKKLPEIGSALGKAIREFKKASREIENEVKDMGEEKGNGKKT